MPETSASLLDRLADRGDDAAWRRLLDLYTPLIRGWLRRQDVPPGEADDLTQEVLAVVVRELPEFRHNRRAGAFRAWLRAITTNCLRRAWRARDARPGRADLGPLLDRLEDPASDPSRAWDREHDRHVLAHLLAGLKPDFQPGTWAAFRRTALDGAPTAAVAAELGVTVNAVLIARSRVVQRLRQLSAGLLD